MMKKIIFFAVFAAWFVTLGVMAQNRPPRNRISQEQFNAIRDQFDQNAPSNKVYRLFPLANRLLTFNSFDRAIRELQRNQYGISFSAITSDGGELNAKCDLCELQVINCDGVPERIDTLTLFVKAALKEDVLQDSLLKANYIQKKHTDTFDWWQRNDGTNLAIYYNYSNDFKTAMLFARPKAAEIEEPAEPTEPTTTDPPVEAVTPPTLMIDMVRLERESIQNACKLTVNISFPEATGGIAGQLNKAALESPLLGNLVSKKPKLTDGMSVGEAIDAYTTRIFDEYWAEYFASNGVEEEVECNYLVGLMPKEKIQEGVLTYINNVKTKRAGNEVDEYRIAANFDLHTGELLTFDKVFRKSAKKALTNLLKERYNEGQMDISDEGKLKEIVNEALQNFILYREAITFIMIYNDDNGLTEKLLTIKREDLEEYLR